MLKVAGLRANKFVIEVRKCTMFDECYVVTVSPLKKAYMESLEKECKARRMDLVSEKYGIWVGHFEGESTARAIAEELAKALGEVAFLHLSRPRIVSITHRLYNIGLKFFSLGLALYRLLRRRSRAPPSRHEGRRS